MPLTHLNPSYRFSSPPTSILFHFLAPALLQLIFSDTIMLFACLYSTCPASASAAGAPCSSSASSLDSLDMPGAWKSSYDALGSKPSSATALPSGSLSTSTRSATIVLRTATSECESAISASAPSFRPVASPEPVSECNTSTATSSSSRLHVSSVSTISDRDASIPSYSVAHIPDAPSAPSSKAGIYGGRRGPTSPSTSPATSVLVAATSASTSVIHASPTYFSAAVVPEPVSDYDTVTSSNSRSHLQSTAFSSPYDGRGSSQPSSTEAGPSPSTNSTTFALGTDTPEYTSFIEIQTNASVSASHSVTPLSIAEPVSVHDSTASGLDNNTPVAEAEATTTSRPTFIAKAGIYGGRRGPTSRSTSTQSSSTSTDAATAPNPARTCLLPSIRRHRATSTKRVGRDMTFGGMIPRGRQSSGLRIIVLVRTGLLAHQRAKKMLEERAKEKERIEKEAREKAVMGGMLEMAREAEREERMEMMARKVKEVKCRRKGMDMEAVPAKQTKKIQIQGWQSGSETEWVMV
ncbi:hypothetical protein C8F01DRAFT_1237541 [Mycena amicta]|nr:hypothetical protein C8F01DRAFT_1237541 [Mycena amicta]